MARRKLLVADLLCGAGGSSTGCARALADLGLEMELVCLNHWPVAIETHTRNHPEARHYCQDIATVRPHIVVPEGYLDLLMASPTCTHHSVARGGKPTSDQQRSDPWHIITWLTELRVKRMIIENVWEFIGWGPVDPRTGKPIKSRKGEYFNAWINVIRSLGFEPEWRKLNSANYGDATTRQRFILKARNDRKIVGWAPLSHRKIPADGNVLPFADVKPWRPAREIIDWNIKGRSIFNRPIPLAPKTLARILAGAVKFGWPAIFHAMLIEELERSLRRVVADSFSKRNGRRAEDRRRHRLRAQAYAKWLRSLRDGAPAPAGSSRSGAAPMIVTLRRHADGRSIGQPLPTVAAAGNHIGLAEPFMVKQNFRRDTVGIDQPAPTIMTEARVGLAQPVVVNMKGQSTSSGVAEPLPTQTSHAGHLYVAEPFVMAPGSTGAPRMAGDPLPTITTGGAGAADPGCARPMLVEPFVLSRHAEGAPHSINEPTPTQVAKHSHVLISPYYGGGSGETCNSAEEPLPTVTSKGRFGMVVPVTHTQGGNAARDVGVPLPTMTTAKGGEFAIVMPVSHHDQSDRVRSPDEPLPTVTGANRGELAFIAAQFGEREGQAPRVHDIEAPAPAICATGHVNLVEATPQYDVLFRMLEPHELAAAMGFTDQESRYEFAGTKTEQIKQIGNAVSVAMMRAEVKAIMADAVPTQRTARETTQPTEARMRRQEA